MSRTIMLVPISAGVGITSVSLGTLRALERNGVSVSFYKPIAETVKHEKNRDRSNEILRRAASLKVPDSFSMHYAESLIGRGDWVVTGNVPGPVRKIDAELRVLKSETRALAHWTPVHVHLGAAETTGRVAVLGEKSVAAGESALVQLVLDHPIGALHGDGLIVRDQSAQRTIGGGRVIDIYPPARGRARPERLAFLRAMAEPDDGTALEALLAVADAGLDLDRFAAARNLSPDDMAALAELVPMKSLQIGGARGFSGDRWAEVRAKVLDGLGEWHRKSPDTVGPGENRILSGTGIRLPAEAAVAIAGELAREGAIVKEGMGVRLPSHRPRLEGPDATTWKKVEPILLDSGLRPPPLAELAREIGGEPRKLESMLVRAGRHGLVVRVAKNRFYLPATLRELGEIAERVAAETGDGMVTAAAFRDASEIGRNVAIEVLEFFDKVKFTRRVGDGHEVVRPAADAFGGD